MSAAAYPSPSLSPAASFEATMKSDGLSVYHQQRRPSAKQLLMNPSTAVSSPLDALVLALEATAEELENSSRAKQVLPSVTLSTAEYPADALTDDDDEDPNATVPSSPTFFMKKPSSGPSLHQLPTLILPSPVAHAIPQASAPGSSLGLTSSTSPRQLHQQEHEQEHEHEHEHEHELHQHQAYQARKMSVSSQSSTSSLSAAGSSNERKAFHCTVTGCDKAFSQMSHLRTHERTGQDTSY
ncbi:hypothetical protein DFQ26_004980 [Actinomortierella ambigua]|nr:hypothetical protein DFQ26_004980 [Actinomortierella ambigua]